MKNNGDPLISAVLSIVCFLIIASVSFAEEQSISPADAQKYIGEKKTVCGMVATATYAVRTKGQPTFLNLDQPYPNQIFTVVIWGSDRKKFSNPPEGYYKRRNICVTGKIKSFKGKTEIAVNDPSQINMR